MMKTVVFIVGQLSQPRCIKRIETIQNAGIPIKVYGYSNNLYSENLDDISFLIERVLVQKGNRITRRFSPYNELKKVFKENKENCIFYVFGFSLAKVLYRLGCRNYIYEEADVNSAKIKNPILRKYEINLDKKIALKSLLTVYTSEGFVNYLFPKVQDRPKYILLQNKLSRFFYDQDRSRIVPCSINTNHIKFGFIGLVRYPNTIGRIARIIAEKFPQHELHFFGDFVNPKDFPTIIFNSKNIILHGPFRNPVDLEDIYKQIDINIACYDAVSATTAINVKIAEPNKLYESIYFKKPLIVSDNTFIANKVKNLGIGTSCLSHDDDSILRFLSNIDAPEFENYSRAAAKISIESLIDAPEQLITLIKEL